MDKTNKQFKLPDIQPYILAIIINILCFTMGILLRDYISNAGMYILTAIILFVVLMLASFIGEKIYSKKHSEMSYANRRQYILKHNEAVKAEYKKAEKKIIFLKNVVYIYILLVILITLFVPFFFGAGTTETSRIYMIIFSVYVQANLISIIIAMLKKPDFSGYEKVEDYPYLHGLAHKAAKTLGIDGPIRIYLVTDCNAGIQRFHDTYSLIIGAQMLAVLNEEELYQVLLHEFGHMTDKHIKVNRSCEVLSCILNTEGNTPYTVFNNLLFKLPEAVFNFEYSLFQFTSSSIHESNADDVVKKYGNPSFSISGLAKIGMYELFQNEYRFLYPTPFYASETPPKHACSHECSNFSESINNRKDFWTTLLEKEIPPLISTHPTFKQRREALNCKEYNIKLPNTDTALYTEYLHVTKSLDERLYESNKDNYEENRKEVYLTPLEKIKEYESGKLQIATSSETRPIIDAYMMLNQFDKVLKICDDIFASDNTDDEKAHAYFVAGYILISKYDNKGAEYLKKAVELNKNYIEEGLELLGRFYSLMGMEKELLEYRAEMDKYLNILEQHEQIFDINKNDILSVIEDLSPFKQSIDYIISIGAANLEKLYLINKRVTDNFSSNVFILEFVDEIDDEEKLRVMQAVFNYLDASPEQYSLFEYDDDFKTILNKLPGSCIFSK